MPDASTADGHVSYIDRWCIIILLSLLARRPKVWVKSYTFIYTYFSHIFCNVLFHVGKNFPMIDSNVLGFDRSIRSWRSWGETCSLGFGHGTVFPVQILSEGHNDPLSKNPRSNWWNWGHQVAKFTPFLIFFFLTPTFSFFFFFSFFFPHLSVSRIASHHKCLLTILTIYTQYLKSTFLILFNQWHNLHSIHKSQPFLFFLISGTEREWKRFWSSYTLFKSAVRKKKEGNLAMCTYHQCC